MSSCRSERQSLHTDDTRILYSTINTFEETIYKRNIDLSCAHVQLHPQENILLIRDINLLINHELNFITTYDNFKIL